MKFLIIALFVLGACSGPKEPASSGISESERVVAKSCREVDLYNEPLSQNNLLSLFQCFGWDKVYSHLFESIGSIDQKTWDAVLAPLNESFFSNSLKQKFFYEYLASLKYQDGYEQISLLLDKLAEKSGDLYTVFKKISTLTEDEIYNLLSVVNVQNFEQSIVGFTNIIELLENEKIKKEINKLRKIDKFNDQFIDVLNRLSELDKNSLELTLEKLGRLNDNDGIVNIIQQKSFRVSDIIDVITIGKKYSELSRYSDFILRHLDDKLTCPSGIKINFRNELEQLTHNVRNKTRSENLEALVDSDSKLLIFNQICSVTDSEVYNKFAYIHAVIDSIVDNKNMVELLLHFHRFTYNSSERDSSFDILRLLSSSSFKEIQEITSLANNNSNLFQMIYDGISSDFVYLNTNLNSALAFVKNKNSHHAIITLLSMWRGMDLAQKKAFVSMLELGLGQDYKISRSLNHIMLFLSENDFGLIQRLRLLMHNSDYAKKIKILLQNVSGDIVAQELISFLSRDNFIKLIKFVTKDTVVEEHVLENHMDLQIPFFFPLSDYSEGELGSISCLHKLNESLFDPFGFQNTLSSYNDICQINTQNYVLPAINIGLAKTSKEIRETTKFDILDSKEGLFNKDLVNMYLGLVLSANQSFNFCGGINCVLDNAMVLQENNILLPILKPALEFVNILTKSKEDFDIDPTRVKSLSEFSFSLFSTLKDGHLSVQRYPDVCPVLISIGDSTCLDKSRLHMYSNELVDELFDANLDKKPLVHNLILAMSSKGLDGVEGESHILSFSDLLSMFYDLGDEGTQLLTTYENSSGDRFQYSLTTIQRIEILLREISFSNNYYGAYFNNTVAAAKNYISKVKSLKKQSKLMNRASGLMIMKNLLPSEAKRGLYNVVESYDSLIEPSTAINNRIHSNTLQTVMLAGVLSSKSNHQSFSPIKRIDEDFIEGHRSLFLTNLAQMGIMTKISSIIRSNFKSLTEFENYLYGDEVKQIDVKLIKFANLNSTYRLIETINSDLKSKKSIKEILEILIKKINSLTLTQQSQLINSLVRTTKLFILSSNIDPVNLSTKELRVLLHFIKAFLVHIDIDEFDSIVRLMGMFNAAFENSEDRGNVSSSLTSILGTVIESLASMKESEAFSKIDNIAAGLPGMLKSFKYIDSITDKEDLEYLVAALTKAFRKDDIDFKLINKFNSMKRGMLSSLIEYLLQDSSKNLNEVLQFMFVDHKNSLESMLRNATESIE